MYNNTFTNGDVGLHKKLKLKTGPQKKWVSSFFVYLSYISQMCPFFCKAGLQSHISPSSYTFALHNSLSSSAGERLVTLQHFPQATLYPGLVNSQPLPSLFASSLCLLSSCLCRITAGVISAGKCLDQGSPVLHVLLFNWIELEQSPTQLRVS